LESPSDASLLEDHITKDCAALNAIHSTIDEENMEIITSATTAREAYLALCEHHGDSGGMTTATMFFELVTMKLSPGSSVADHVHKFRTLHNRFKSNTKSLKNISISDHYIAILLLKSLPADYNSLVQTTLTSNFENISLSHIYMLLSMETMRIESSTENIAMSAQTVQNSKPPRPAKQTRICSLGHLGHSDERCYTRIRKEEKELAQKYKELMKTKVETAALTTTKTPQASTSSSITPITPSYYDEAYAVGSQDLSVVSLDTACTSHMFGSKILLHGLQSIPPSPIQVASKTGDIYAHHRGTAHLDKLRLERVIYSPELSANLVSAGMLYDAGYDIIWTANTAEVISPTGTVLLTFYRDTNNSRLWQIQVSPPSPLKAFATKADSTAIADLWHRRLGHLHPSGVVQFLKSSGMKAPAISDFGFCESCAMGKTTRTPATSSFHRSDRVLACVHSDLMGPINPLSVGGKQYIMTFVDDFTRYNSVYLLKSKSEAFNAFKHYQLWMEANTGHKLLKLKTDRGGEYSSTEFLEYLRSLAIDTERGPARRPQANSVAERFNRTLLGRIRTQFFQSGLPFFLWGELVAYASVQLNSSPSVAINNRSPLAMITPFFKGHYHPIKPSRFKPFGCQGYVLDNDASKLHPTAKRMVLVGLEPGSNAYRLWDKTTRRIVISSDVKFDENSFPATNHALTPSRTQIVDVFPDIMATISSDSSHASRLDSESAISSDDGRDPTPMDVEDRITDHQETNPDSLLEDVTSIIPTRRSTRITVPPERYGFIARETITDTCDNPTYEAAMNGPDKHLWRKAMEDEFEAFTQHNVGTLVNKPEDANVIGGMWIFSRKRDEHHRIIKHKARWVIFGNHQIHGFDYFDTYASVGKSDSLRILLSMAATDGWEILQFDIVTAFLNGDMKDTVHCRQVRGFRDKRHPEKVWQLNRSLYGSRQGARRWQEHFEETIKLFNLKPTPSDPAVYVSNDSRGRLYIHLHVDDSMVMSNSSELMSAFRSHLDNKYTVKWTEKPTLYLGIQIDYDQGTKRLRMYQAHYIENVLDRFAMTNCNTVKTPLPPNTILTSGTDEEVAEASEIPYQSLIGFLQWLSNSTRPDISHAVSQLSRFNSKWTMTHWLMGKHVLRYLKGTSTLGITFGGKATPLQVYSDADFPQCPETRRSVTGYIFCLNNGSVSWNSQRQHVVALSTSEAEYMAASEAARHLSWVRDFLFDIFHQQTAPTSFFIDSTSAVAVITEQAIKKRSKHIDRRYHHIREQHQDGKIEIIRIPTTEMLADFLTKPLARVLLQKAVDDNKMS